VEGSHRRSVKTTSSSDRESWWEKSREWIRTTTEASRTIHFIVVSSSGVDENGGRKEGGGRQSHAGTAAADGGDISTLRLGFWGTVTVSGPCTWRRRTGGVANGRTGWGDACSRDARNAREMVKAPEGS
jgi:hypothetical protein